LAVKRLIIYQTRIAPILIRRVLLLHGLDEAIRINVCREHKPLSAGAVTEWACSGDGEGSCMGGEVRRERKSADGDSIEALYVISCHDVSDGARIEPEGIAAVG
jgi:hypothetical protein